MSKKYTELINRVNTLESREATIAGNVSRLIESEKAAMKQLSELEQRVGAAYRRSENLGKCIEDLKNRIESLEFRLSADGLILEFKDWVSAHFQPIGAAEPEACETVPDTAAVPDCRTEDAADEVLADDKNDALVTRTTKYDPALEWINLTQLRDKYKGNCLDLFGIRELHKGDIAMYLVRYGLLKKQTWGYSMTDLGPKTGLIREIRVKNSNLIQFKNCAETDELIVRLFTNPGLARKYVDGLNAASQQKQSNLEVAA